MHILAIALKWVEVQSNVHQLCVFSWFFSLCTLFQCGFAGCCGPSVLQSFRWIFFLSSASSLRFESHDGQAQSENKQKKCVQGETT